VGDSATARGVHAWLDSGRGREISLRETPWLQSTCERAFGVWTPWRTAFELVGVHRHFELGPHSRTVEDSHSAFPSKGSVQPIGHVGVARPRGDDPIVRYRVNMRRHSSSRSHLTITASRGRLPAAISMPEIALFVGVTSHLLSRYFHAVHKEESDTDHPHCKAIEVSRRAGHGG